MSYYSPTYFEFGKDAENKTGELVKRFGGSKVLLHYGGGSVVRSGLLDRVDAEGNLEVLSDVAVNQIKTTLCRGEGILKSGNSYSCRAYSGQYSPLRSSRVPIAAEHRRSQRSFPACPGSWRSLHTHLP